MGNNLTIRILLFLLFLGFCPCFRVDAQTPRIDSLKSLSLNYLAADSTRANILIALCKAYSTEVNDKKKVEEYVPELLALSQNIKFKKGIAYAYLYTGLVAMGKSDYEIALEHYQKAEQLMEELKDKNGMGTCYIYMGNAKNDQGKYTEAIDYKLKAVKIKEELDDKHGLANSYNSIGVTYTHIGKNMEALNYYFKALRIREAIHDKQGVSSTYLNIGIVMYWQGNVAGSLDYHEKSLQIKQELGDKEGAAIVYNNIANIYIEQKKYREALIYSFKSMKIAEEIQEKRIVNNCYLNIANIFSEQKKFKKALPYYLKTIKISIELEDRAGAATAYNSMGNCYEEMKQFAEALNNYMKALSISKEINYKIGIRDAYSNLASVNEKLQNCDQALFYNKQFGTLKDSLLNEESLKQTAELNTRYQMEKKENEILLLTKDQLLKDKTLKEQRLIRIGLISVISLLLVVSFLLFNRYRFKQKANRILEKQKEEIHYKNKQITDSIDYAKTIQEAILPDEDKLTQAFPEHFIFYKPKAIVSGDFYWTGRKEEQIVCAVADCTGHGVPGAFMSLLGHNILENVIQRDTSVHPGAILTALNKEIVGRFSTLKDEGTIKHAMDIAILSLNKQRKQLQYAGARNPLYIIRGNELIEIKADRMSTGIIAKDNQTIVYTNHVVDLQTGDMLYMFSDGFADQKGGPDKRKFFHQPFKELLATISYLPVEEQKSQLDTVIQNWMGDGEQIDDILVMGIRITS